MGVGGVLYMPLSLLPYFLVEGSVGCMIEIKARNCTSMYIYIKELNVKA